MKQSSNKPKKSCSLWSVLLLLIFIFLLLLSGIIFIRAKHGVIDIKKIKSPNPNITLEEKFKKQLDSQKGEEKISITLSEQDLTEALKMNEEGFPLKSPTVTVVPEKILLKGKSSDSILSFKLDISIIPTVSEGKIAFEIKEIKTGGVAAPKIVVEKVSGELKGYLSQFSTLERDIVIEKADLRTGYLTVTGRRR